MTDKKTKKNQKKLQTNSKQIHYVICNFKWSKQSNLYKHELTAKHILLTTVDKKSPKTPLHLHNDKEEEQE